MGATTPPDFGRDGRNDALRNSAAAARCWHLLLGLLLALLAGPAAAAENGSLTPVSVQLNWKHQFEFAAFYAALEHGYYRDAGLDVSLREGGPGIDVVREVSEGRADFGVGTSSLVVSRYRGAPVVAVATLMQHSPIGLLARRRPDLQSVHDLAGRPVAVDPHSRDEIEAFLKASGLAADRIRLVEQVDWTLDSLQRGMIAAKTIYISNESFMIRGHEHDYLQLTPRSAGIDLFGNMLFTTSRLVGRDPATVQAFRDATLKGLVYALDHAPEIADLIIARYNSQGKSRDHLLFEAAQIRELTRPDIVEPGYMSAGRWRHVVEVYADQGQLPHNFDLLGFLFQPKSAEIPPWLAWTLAGAIAALLITLIFATQLRKLNITLSREVSDRRQAEAALQASESKYRELVENANAIILKLGLDGSVTYFNEYAERFFGFSSDEILGQSVVGTILPERESGTNRDLAAMFRAVLADPEQFKDNENENVTRDGRRVHIHWNNRFIRDEAGQTTGLLCIGQDVTERVRAETNLQIMNSAIAGTINGIALGTLDGHIAYVNASFLRLWGYADASEVLGRHHLELWADPDRAAALAGTLTPSHGIVGEFQARRRDGSTFHIQLSASMIADDEGNPQRLMVSCVDIDKRKRAEQSLRDSEHRFSTIFRTSPIAMALGRRDDRIFVDVNDIWNQLLGYSANEIIGRSADDLQFWVRADDRDRAVAQMAASGAIRNLETVFRRKDGSTMEVSFSSEQIMIADEWFILAAFADISLQKESQRILANQKESLEQLVSQRTEQFRLAKEEAEHLARVKGEFLANMSHEIRTPLNGVLGMARIGIRESEGRTRAQQTFARIIDSGKLLLGILNDILDFSKIEAGKLKIEATWVELDAVLLRCLELVQERADAKGIALLVKRSPNLPNSCLSDPIRIGQILINLLSNAIKFTESGSVTLAAERDGPWLIFRVSDTGIGMSPDEIHRIFAPFEQADGSTTRKYGGTGLGLTITQRIVELMAGRIRVTSTPGAGSSFVVHLPYTATPPTAAGQRRQGAPGVPGQRLLGLSVLVAEDNAINQVVIEDLLLEDGARVVLASNGQQAVDCVANQPADTFDVVLMDIQMPVMNGHEATRRILERVPDLPIIGQTAHAFADEKEACRASGMVDHLAKPIDPDELVATILRHVATRGPKRAWPRQN